MSSFVANEGAFKIMKWNSDRIEAQTVTDRCFLTV